MNKRVFQELVKNVTVMPQRLDSQLPHEPVFDPATDLYPDLLKAEPKLHMLEDYFGYTAEELEYCASKVGTSEPVKLLSQTGLEKFRRVVDIFQEQGLVMSQKNPDREAIRCGLYHSKLLYDFMTDSTVLEYFSKVAGIELIPLPIHWSQIQINLIPAYNPDAKEPGFGTHVDSTNFACVMSLTKDQNIEGGALQHARMTREQFWQRTGTNSIANAELHIILPADELRSTNFTEEGSAVFQQGVLIPHQVENVRRVDGYRVTVACTFHPANPMVRRLDAFSTASTWNSRDMKEDIGKLLLDLAGKRIEALTRALELAEDLSGSADAISTQQMHELRAGLLNSEQLKGLAERFLVDLVDGVEGISCPDDTLETPSVFDVSYPIPLTQSRLRRV
jgi:Ni,Fe-hydrogenase III component G